MATVAPLMSTLVFASRPRRLLIFVRILVLSGWSSKPYCLASCCSCASMAVTCGSVGASKRTSSAKRRLVSCVVVACPSCTPKPLWSHVLFKSLKSCSKTALKSRELSGSPCLTPRCSGKLLLTLSLHGGRLFCVECADEVDVGLWYALFRQCSPEVLVVDGVERLLKVDGCCPQVEFELVCLLVEECGCVEVVFCAVVVSEAGLVGALVFVKLWF